MSKKFFTTLFLFTFCVSVSFAQSINKQWEYLEVSQIIQTYNTYTQEVVPYRTYNFFNSGKIVSGTTSLDWIGKSGWELVGAVSTGENSLETKLIFKRLYNEQVTNREIEELEKSFKERLKKPPAAELIDLDAQEAKQNLDEFNRKEEERLRTALSKINNSPIKVVNIKSLASVANKTSLAAEIVVDGTSALLKDGNKYRLSEAKTYLQEVAKQVLAVPDLNLSSFSQNVARFQIGKLSNNYGRIIIGITVVVNYKNNQIVVAQGVATGDWKEIKP